MRLRSANNVALFLATRLPFGCRQFCILQYAGLDEGLAGEVAAVLIRHALFFFSIPALTRCPGAGIFCQLLQIAFFSQPVLCSRRSNSLSCLVVGEVSASFPRLVLNLRCAHSFQLEFSNKRPIDVRCAVLDFSSCLCTQQASLSLEVHLSLCWEMSCLPSCVLSEHPF